MIREGDLFTDEEILEVKAALWAVVSIFILIIWNIEIVMTKNIKD